MQLKLMTFGNIIYSTDEKNVPELKIRGAKAAIDFTEDGLVDGIIGINTNIPMDASATVDDITLTALQVTKFLRKLAKPAARASAHAQASEQKPLMPSEAD